MIHQRSAQKNRSKESPRSSGSRIEPQQCTRTPRALLVVNIVISRRPWERLSVDLYLNITLVCKTEKPTQRDCNMNGLTLSSVKRRRPKINSAKHRSKLHFCRKCKYLSIYLCYIREGLLLEIVLNYTTTFLNLLLSV